MRLFFAAVDADGNLYEAYTSEFIVAGRLLYSQVDKLSVERFGVQFRLEADENFIVTHPQLQHLRLKKTRQGAKIVGGLPESKSPWKLARASLRGQEVVMSAK